MTDLLPVRPHRTTESPVVRSGDSVVLTPDIAAPPVVLNQTALALWELCDGSTTVTEMVDAVSALFALEPARARADVENALRDMLATGVIR
ncbi:PqqD family protein [Nocardioides euryhalodurans]|uniref:PqqD family protein n=1 Tax=Nocardioides euryhalodurans TaxID=2518370 RepID=A0A4P7GH44_9ACTN|nr:PqqD family protein [Nocardioides euryhalodurans]QBR91200.1 PqqD family protein [Nocardioides euryhalodurans]